MGRVFKEDEDEDEEEDGDEGKFQVMKVVLDTKTRRLAQSRRKATAMNKSRYVFYVISGLSFGKPFLV